MPERHREDHLSAFNRYLETGERANDWRNVEFEVLHRDGHEVPVSISYGEFEEDGEQRFVGIIRDITAWKAHESELQKALEKFQTLVEQNVAGIYLIRDDRFEYVNQRFCAITGYDEEELTSMDVLEIIAPESRDDVEANIAKRLGGELEDVEYAPTFLRKDGELRKVRAHGSRIELDGAPAILGTVVDSPGVVEP
jgi:PAS domain S-box-containing protein